MIKANEGKIDRVFRVLLGGLLMSAGFIIGDTGGWIMVVVGAIPLLTGLVGWCPVYSLLKINTCPLEKR